MSNIQGKGKIYQPYYPEKQKTSRPVKSVHHEAHSSEYSIKSGVTNQFLIQQELHTIGIYDHEWEALKKVTTKIKTGCSKYNLGNLIDGFGAGIIIPFCLDLYKLITIDTITSELRNETFFYFICFVGFLILEGIKFFAKPKWLTNYSSLYSDIETLDDRFSEIDGRIGLTKEE